jgi:hypothetical protein
MDLQVMVRKIKAFAARHKLLSTALIACVLLSAFVLAGTGWRIHQYPSRFPVPLDTLYVNGLFNYGQYNVEPGDAGTYMFKEPPSFDMVKETVKKFTDNDIPVFIVKGELALNRPSCGKPRSFTDVLFSVAYLRSFKAPDEFDAAIFIQGQLFRPDESHRITLWRGTYIEGWINPGIEFYKRLKFAVSCDSRTIRGIAESGALYVSYGPNFFGLGWDDKAQAREYYSEQLPYIDQWPPKRGVGPIGYFGIYLDSDGLWRLIRFPKPNVQLKDAPGPK